MKIIPNWSYTKGMARTKMWEDEGHEVTLVHGVNEIHIYRYGKYVFTMDKQDAPQGYKLKQVLN